MIFIQIIYYYVTYLFLIDSTTTKFFHESKLCNNLTSCKNVSLQILISSHPGNEWTESTLQFRTYKKINNNLRQKRSFNPTVATTVNNNTKILNNNLPSNVSIWTIQPNILRAHIMLLPYKSRHLLRKKSVFFRSNWSVCNTILPGCRVWRFSPRSWVRFKVPLEVRVRKNNK